MKGVVFTEFLEWVETQGGVELADRVIVRANLASAGSYTAVGTYDHRELLALFEQLASATGRDARSLVRRFGEYLFGRFAIGYPEFFAVPSDTFGFLERIDAVIHVEVHKLYPDAELPHIECRRDASGMELVYRSQRPFGDFAEGLIRGCIAYFGERIELARHDLPGEPGFHVRFQLTRVG